MDAVVDTLLEPFRYSFMARALVVSVLVGATAPLVGSYAITRGLAFMGDAMAHAILPGMVGGFLVGLNPLVATVPAGAAVALLIGYISRRTGLSEDTSIGILFAGLFALGLAMLSLAEGLPVDLEDLLLGRVLGVSAADAYITLGLAGLVAAALYALHKELVFASFDPVGATVSGLPTAALDYVLLVLLALVVVLSLQAVGIVLIMAMLITPAATAYLLTRRMVHIMALGAAIGAASAAAGLYLSFYLNLPSGPAMTLVAVGIFALVAAVRRRAP